MNKPGKRVQLDRDHLIQMAISPDFYIAVPAFLYLKEVAMASWNDLQTKVDCKRCYHEWNAMRGVVDAMFLKLQELRSIESPVLDDIKGWLGSRKGYPVSRCVLYYRRSRSQGAIAKFEF